MVVSNQTLLWGAGEMAADSGRNAPNRGKSTPALCQDFPTSSFTTTGHGCIRILMQSGMSNLAGRVLAPRAPQHLLSLHVGARASWQSGHPPWDCSTGFLTIIRSRTRPSWIDGFDGSGAAVLVRRQCRFWSYCTHSAVPQHAAFPLLPAWYGVGCRTAVLVEAKLAGSSAATAGMCAVPVPCCSYATSATPRLNC